MLIILGFLIISTIYIFIFNKFIKRLFFDIHDSKEFILNNSGFVLFRYFYALIIPLNILGLLKSESWFVISIFVQMVLPTLIFSIFMSKRTSFDESSNAGVNNFQAYFIFRTVSIKFKDIMSIFKAKKKIKKLNTLLTTEDNSIFNSKLDNRKLRDLKAVSQFISFKYFNNNLKDFKIHAKHLIEFSKEINNINNNNFKLSKELFNNETFSAIDSETGIYAFKTMENLVDNILNIYTNASETISNEPNEKIKLKALKLEKAIKNMG